MDVHLVDGTYELFRAYFGAPPAKAPDGREVGATRSLARSMLSLLRAGKATHVAVAFDHTVESFRNELFDGYKTGEGIDPDLFSQFELAEEAVRALGIVVWPMVEFEADDALAAGAARYSAEAEVDRVWICTPDKDLAQCVRGERVVGLDRRREKILTEDGVKEKFGVAPRSIPDWLALVGDAADGIPGVPRWGARSAASALSEYERIEQIPSDFLKWSFKVRGAASLSKSLEEHRDEAALYRELATLREDVPLTESLADLCWQGADRSILATFCESIGEQELPDRVHRWRG